MGFKSVYQCLQELFPQIDYRILRAVAIEHSNDTDAAVEVVLLEILPSLKTSAIASSLPTPSTPIPLDEEEGSTLIRNSRTLEKSSTSFPVSQGNGTRFTDSPLAEQLSNVHEINGISTSLIEADYKHEDNARDNENIVSVEKSENRDVLPTGNHPLEEFLDTFWTETSADTSVSHLPNSELLLESENNLEPQNATQHESDAMNGHGADLLCEENFVSDTSKCLNGICNEEILFVTSPEHLVASVPDQMKISELAKSSQDQKISILEEMIDEAKSNKKNLFAAMEAVLKMMHEVEAKEKEAILAKEDADRGGLHILDQVKNLKQIVPQAKEANNMHAGEVYGEKAILSTELKELQARLTNLADDRDGALSVLDEMAQSLQDRISAAEDMKKTAELDKFEKEEHARKALEEMESIMEEVVNESKMLQAESEENTKLRQFLMDRGRIVDTLQGEISVICLDVKLLKEKFDDRVPLSKSITSNQTSCILASSLRNSASKSESLASSDASFDYNFDSNKAKLEDERIIKCDYAALADDEWELFDPKEISSST